MGHSVREFHLRTCGARVRLVTSGDLLVAIDEADWERFAGPEYYDPESARRSLRELASVENEAAADTAYNDVL